MIEKVINKDNMNRALNMLLTDKNHRGYDEVNTHDLPEFLRLNLDDIYLDGEIKIKDAVYNLLHYSFSATQSAKNLISIVS